MFYYVIYNSTVLNYSNNNKNLNTFIYGTVLYILSHGLINSYDNQFAKYIKSYFWIVLAIDIFSIYYLHNFINLENDNENENDKNSLKNLLNAFYNNNPNKISNTNTNTNTNTNANDGKDNQNEKDNQIKNNEDEGEDDNENININGKKDENELGPGFDKKTNENNYNEPLAYFPDEQDFNENIDQMSDAGSDIDLDKFEESLQN
jgi:hypothetical protein